MGWCWVALGCISGDCDGETVRWMMVWCGMVWYCMLRCFTVRPSIMCTVMRRAGGSCFGQVVKSKHDKQQQMKGSPGEYCTALYRLVLSCTELYCVILRCAQYSQTLDTTSLLFH